MLERAVMQDWIPQRKTFSPMARKRIVFVSKLLIGCGIALFVLTGILIGMLIVNPPHTQADPRNAAIASWCCATVFVVAGNYFRFRFSDRSHLSR
jgi:hypothetical protein